MAQQEGPAAATPTWGQQMSSYNIDNLAESARELGLQASRSGSGMDQVVSADTIPSLVALLSSSDTKAQEHAVSLLSGLSENSSNRGAIIAAGAVPTLVGLLRSNSLLIQSAAAMTLDSLANSSSNRAKIISAGAIPLLQTLCSSDQLFVQLAAATTLFHVAADHNQFGSLSATCALPSLLRTLQPRNSKVKATAGNVKGDTMQAAVQDSRAGSSSPATTDEHSNRCSEKERQKDQDALTMKGAAQVTVLCALKESLCDTSFHPGLMLNLQLAAGVPKALVTVLNASNTAAQVQVSAMEVMSEMMSLDRDTATHIAAAGAIQALLPLLQHGKACTYEGAATALYYLVADNDNNKAAFVREGGLHTLATFLAVPGKQMHAVNLLDGLVSGGKASSNILSAAVAAGVIVPSLQLLRASDTRTKHWAVSVLCTLARHSSSYQDAICTAGAIPELISLLPYTEAGYNAAVLLLDLIKGNGRHRAAFAAAGGFGAMIIALRSSDSQLQEMSAVLLSMMATSSGSYQEAAIAAGAIPALVFVLKGHNVKAQIEAAGALANLSVPASHLQFAADMGNMATGGLTMLHTNIRGSSSHKGVWHAAAEAVPVLVSLLKQDNVELLQAVSAALGNIFNTSSAFAQAFEAADGLTAIVSMLNSCEHPVQLLAFVLLRNYNKCTNFGRLE